MEFKFEVKSTVIGLRICLMELESPVIQFSLDFIRI